MKKQILVLLLTFWAAACFSQTILETQKAQSAAKSYLLRHLNDPGSYKPVKWTKLSKTFTNFGESKISKLITDSIEFYKEGKINIERTLNSMHTIPNYSNDSTYLSFISLNNQVDSAIKSLNNRLEIQNKAYRPTIDGYYIEHTFRAKNKFNALVLQNYVFILNRNFRVTSSGDTEEIEKERQDLQRRIDELTNGN